MSNQALFFLIDAILELKKEPVELVAKLHAMQDELVERGINHG